jgi:hypothetical protein
MDRFINVDNFLHIDIETVPGGSLAPLDSFPDDKRIKDPEKQEAAKLKKQAEMYEKQSLSPFHAQIISMAYVYNDEKIVGQFEENNELKLLIALESYLESKIFAPLEGTDDIPTRPADFAWVGFNIRGFDLNMIYLRALKYGLFKLAHFIPRAAFSKNVIDVMELIKGGDKMGKGYTQDAIGGFLGIGGKGAISGADVYPMYKEGRFKEIVEYNVDDVGKERAIFNIIKKGLDYEF